MDLYGVMGRPVAHSRSPFLFQQFAAQTGHRLTYEAIETSPEQFKQTLQDFKKRGGKGVNVTLPLKEIAFQLADTLSERARIAKAVNVLLWRDDGTLHGDNVDGIGLIKDITQHYHYPLTGKHILVIGAGGAVRGILQPLLNENPATVTIVNRTPDKARTLAAEFGLKS